MKPHIQHEISPHEAFPSFDHHNLGFDTDGKKIEFPDVEYYGFDHASHTAKLARFILEGDSEACTEQNQRILWAACIFHDIGRTEPWYNDDPHHAIRSAHLFEIICRSDKELWYDDTLRESAAKLIANHNKPPGHDPVAIALHDADCYEAVRVKTGDTACLKFIRRQHDKVVTDWMKNDDRLKHYMGQRGW